MQKFIFQTIGCVVIASLLTLTFHIYLQGVTQDFIAKLLEGLNTDIPVSSYNHVIIFFAYVTSFFQMSVIAFVYYHTNHLIPVTHKISKILILTLITLAYSGQLFRVPFMNYLVYYYNDFPGAFKLSIISQLDPWLSKLVTFSCLVYLCPKKADSASN